MFLSGIKRRSITFVGAPVAYYQNSLAILWLIEFIEKRKIYEVKLSLEPKKNQHD